MDENVKKQLLGLKIAVGILAGLLVIVMVFLGILFVRSTKNTGANAPVDVSQAGDVDSIAKMDSDSSRGSGDETGRQTEGNTQAPDQVEEKKPESDDDDPESEKLPQSGQSDPAKEEASQSGKSDQAKEEASQSGKSDREEASQSQDPSAASDEKADGYVLTYSVGNSWEDGGTKMCTVEFSLGNHTSDSLKDWQLVLEIDKLVSVTGWNGTYSADGSTLTIVGADHNKEIFAEGTVYLGCNIGTEGTFKIKAAKVNGKPCIVKGGSVDQNTQNSGSGNAGSSNSESSDSGNDKNSSSVDVEAILKRAENAKQGDDWLHTDGRRILDKDGKEVWLTGVNWFGYNTGTNTFDGLWTSKLEPTVKAVADHGFNLIRVPFSAQLINQWAAGEYPRANYNQAYNSALTSMNSLEIFDYFLTLAEANGIKVMIDIHCAETNASGHMVNLWYSGSVSTEDYYAALEWMAARYKNNDTIIAYDLKNEPHGKPDEGNGAAIWNNSKQSNNWKYVAETAAAKVLAKNPNVLILVEGTEIYPKNNRGDYSSTNSADYYFNWWGGNLRAVKDFPIDLGKYQDKLVYSPHDYGPTVYQQPWFSGGYTFDSLMKDCWHDNWFYIYEDDTAPLLIGEWGGFMTEPNLTWMTYMRQLISTYHLNHTFWCLNANSGDTGGLLLDDFTTWDSKKYNFVKEVLWQENGKFVGLDHEIPLGENGITLKDAKGL